MRIIYEKILNNAWTSGMDMLSSQQSIVGKFGVRELTGRYLADEGFVD